MKTIFAVALLAAGMLTVAPASAQYTYGSNNRGYNNLYGSGSNSSSHTTSGYVNQRGTYVAPHQQTNPNSTQFDNYSTRGNYNPYTGRTGTRSPRW